MQSNVAVQVALQEKLRFIGRSNGVPQDLSIDYYPPLGDRAGFTGLEVLLLALAGCSGQTVAFLLRKMNQPLEQLEVKATGTRKTEHPMTLVDIKLVFRLHGPALNSEAVAKAVNLAEEQYCPVWAMIKPGTKIDSSFELV